MSEKNFKISSALKNLIGKELITDKYVAIFELVKNAYDAGATEAKITFVADEEGHCTKIIIEDDGCGMDAKDLEEKWLFVGYSEKNLRNSNYDYRNHLSSRRNMAGAKGVGRFSCDRLGQKLRLVSRKDGGDYNELLIDWGKFEKNSREVFSKIPVTYQSDAISEVFGGAHGTYLEVSMLRDEWDRASLIALKAHLMKLINPISLHEDDFSVVISAKYQEKADVSEKYEHRKVNGIVRNFVFEKLGLKTTGIRVEISKDGKTISTQLSDRGKLIYELTERNSAYTLLRNITVYIYQLNQNAKRKFASVMGTSPIAFGSIFVYKNGFRIYPYGEPGDDSLRIDQRKQQGYNRFFGTREIIGRIEIWGEQTELRETTSRSGGIVKNDTYEQLRGFFTELCLKRLEKYAVDVVRWGEISLEPEELDAIQKLEVSDKILRIISNLSNSANVLDVRYDDDFLAVLNDAQAESSSQLPENLLNLAKIATDKVAAKKIRAAASNIKALAAARKQAVKAAEKLTLDNAKMQSEIQRKDRQVLFLTEAASPKTEYFFDCCHSIITYADAIAGWVRMFNRARENGEFALDKCQRAMSGIAEANSRILLLTRFITRANFNVAAQDIRGDIVQFVHEYCSTFLANIHAKRISIECVTTSIQFESAYTPLEFGLLIENLVSNAIKAKAKKIRFEFTKVNNQLVVDVSDDGKGSSLDASDLPRLFEKGYTTTDGSGLGLYQVAKCMQKMGGSAEIDAKCKKGFKIKLILPSNAS